MSRGLLEVVRINVGILGHAIGSVNTVPCIKISFFKVSIRRFECTATYCQSMALEILMVLRVKSATVARILLSPVFGNCSSNHCGNL